MPAKKRTFDSEVEDLKRRLEGLDGEIDLVREAGNRDRKVRGFDVAEADRTRRGTTRANHEAARAHRRVDGLEERTGILESASNAVIKSMTDFVGLFQTRVSNLNADSAIHEERISRLETTTNSTSYGSIFATWLAVVVSVVGGMLIAHAYLAERYTAFYQGKTINIGAHPGYDAIFWAAGLVAVVATTVAAIVAASSGSSSRSSTKTNSSRHAASVSATASSADSTAVSEDYAYVETTPTEITPVVRV